MQQMGEGGHAAQLSALEQGSILRKRETESCQRHATLDKQKRGVELCAMHRIQNQAYTWIHADRICVDKAQFMHLNRLSCAPCGPNTVAGSTIPTLFPG